jgi:riboflavin synthase
VFAGLIAEVGRVRSLRRRGAEGILTLSCSRALEGAKPGDSIAVDGACLTVEELSPEGFSAFLSAETLSKTTLGELRAGAPANLEAALRPTDRLGGHMVQGHVEAVGRVASLRTVGEGAELEVEIPSELTAYVIPKGSIALAGVSLTVAALAGRSVTVAVIPATLRSTTLSHWRPGARVNVETDLVGRYIVTYLRGLTSAQGLTVKDLIDKGF